jgi:hypothetical protein
VRATVGEDERRTMVAAGAGMPTRPGFGEGHACARWAEGRGARDGLPSRPRRSKGGIGPGARGREQAGERAALAGEEARGPRG